MPSARELAKLKADPERWAAYKAHKAAAQKRWKDKNRDKVLADQKRSNAENHDKVVAQKKASRARHLEYARASDLLRWYARKEAAADVAAEVKFAPQLDGAGQMAIYNRAVALLPSSIPIENRRSYAAAALVAVADGILRPDFSRADLETFRREDLPMGATAKFVFVAENALGILAGLY